MKVEREFLTSFLNLGFATELTYTEFSRNSRFKKALCYMVSHNYSLGKDSHFNYTSGEKKLG